MNLAPSNRILISLIHNQYLIVTILEGVARGVAFRRYHVDAVVDVNGDSYVVASIDFAVIMLPMWLRAPAAIRLLSAEHAIALA